MMPGVPWLIRVESLSDSDSAAARPAAAGQRRRAPCTPGTGGPGGLRHGFRITFQVNHDSDLIIESGLIGTSHLKTWCAAPEPLPLSSESKLPSMGNFLWRRSKKPKETATRVTETDKAVVRNSVVNLHADLVTCS